MPKIYKLYLSSHSLAPDFEYDVEAETKEEALKKIRKETGNSLIEWEDDILLENIKEIDEVSGDYPIGGMIEPYDIEKEKELTN